MANAHHQRLVHAQTQVTFMRRHLIDDRHHVSAFHFGFVHLESPSLSNSIFNATVNELVEGFFVAIGQVNHIGAFVKVFFELGPHSTGAQELVTLSVDADVFGVIYAGAFNALIDAKLFMLVPANPTQLTARVNAASTAEGFFIRHAL
jgi:hypothetical protein